MENDENGCVILKRKEYDELLARANVLEKKNKDKKIIINWRYTYGDNYNHPLEVYGDFILGSKLYAQINSILLSITEKCKTEFSDIYQSGINVGKTSGKTSGETNSITKFKKLVWYKRLFFKEKYIK